VRLAQCPDAVGVVAQYDVHLRQSRALCASQRASQQGCSSDVCQQFRSRRAVLESITIASRQNYSLVDASFLVLQHAGPDATEMPEHARMFDLDRRQVREIGEI
jgi:hypothetical protein